MKDVAKRLLIPGWGIRHDLKARAAKREAAEATAATNRQAIEELRQLAGRLPDSEGVIGPDGFREFIEFVSSHNIDLNAVPDIRREVRLGLAQGGFFLETETTLLLKKDEAALLDAPSVS